MYWNRVKTILLTVLIAVNIYLGYTVWSFYRSQEYISDSYASRASQALSAMGIDIAPETIPQKKPGEPIVIASERESEAQYFASKLAGGAQIEKVSQDGVTVYSGGGMTLSLYSDLSFEYTAKSSSAEESVSLRKAQSLAGTFIELSGLTRSDFEITASEQTEEGVSITVQRMINSLPAEGFEAQIDIAGGTVVSAKGKLFAGKINKEIETDFSDSVNVLFALAGTGQKYDIEEMRLVYVPSENGSETIFTPMYLIKSNGNKFKYDLSTGQIIS